jgi:RuvC nuclease domain
MQKHRKKKFLKTIYDIQNSFGSHFGNISRNFSFGIKPSEKERIKLETWFTQVNEAKKQLYKQIHEDYKLKTYSYLGASFNYGTFFKGNAVFDPIKTNRNLVSWYPVIEGFSMEISGSIRSFITNHKRIYEENISEIARIKKRLSENKEKSESACLDTEDTLVEYIKKLNGQSYEDIVTPYKSLQEYENLLLAFNEIVAEYNYEANQLNTAQKLDLSMLDKLSRLPAFPGVTEKQHYELEIIFEKLKEFSNKEMQNNTSITFLKNVRKRIERKPQGRKKRFEDRLSVFIYKKYNNDLSNQVSIVNDFADSLNKQITKLENHFAKKTYDAASRNKYFELLAFKAKLVRPEIAVEINTLLSKVKSYFLQGKSQREIITIPGFSWDKSLKGKPLKNTALAFKDKQLYICVASSSMAFTIDDEKGNLIFVKTSGGQKRKNSEPKTIEYVKGSLHEDIENDVPLLLALHFGKSYARRYLFNKQWGLFSKSPKIFLNNARIKREKINPGDPWRYYFDVSISGEKVFGFKDFAHNILAKAESVIGIDRGEAKPIAYTVLGLHNKEVLEKGFLAGDYIEKLKNYDVLRRDYQSRGRIVPKYLKSKITRLQKTLLETAASEILALIAKYKGAVILENLNDKFRGSEKSLIPKKTYKKVEKLLTDSLQLAGLLRTDNKGSYWGALKTVFPAGTSQTCLVCNQLWNKDFKEEIITFSKDKDYQNINFTGKFLNLDTKQVYLSDTYTVFNRERKYNEKKNLADLKDIIRGKEEAEIIRYLKKAIGPRIAQDTFICGLCGSKENADIVGATNIAKRGAKLIQKIIQR